MKRMLVVALCLGNLVVACDSGDSSSDGPSACVPGKTVTCPCGAAGEGIQTCLLDGTFGPCDCSAECTQSTDCPASRPICTPALTCAECRFDSDCPAGKPLCDEEVGTCIGCRSDEDCSGNETCDVTCQLCAPTVGVCATDADCAEGTTCQPVANGCAARTCQVDQGTGGAGGSGGDGGSGGVGGGGTGGGGSLPCVPDTTVSCSCDDGSTGTQTCLSDGTFGACDCTAECQQNTDCPVERSFCIDGVCRECVAHSDCPISKPTCTPAMTCAPCRSNSDCHGDRSVCDEDAGTCHVCLANTDCPTERPRCSLAKTCVECLDSGDCDGGTCIDGVCSPCVLISPNDLDFGTVRPGCSYRTREIQIVNICDSTLVVDRVEVGPEASDEFSITEDSASGVTLPAGGLAFFTMAYKPTDEGPDLGSVLVYVQNVTEPYVAALRGREGSDATQTDTFTQGERQKVDVLWVIDNSGSMGEEQAILANNLEAFLSFAQEIDFQIGVTTTGLTSVGVSALCPGGAHGGEDGRLFPVDGSRPRIITPNTPKLAEVWSNNFSVGICHSDEQPLEAAYRALTPPVIDHDDDPRHPELNDGNRGFLREDARLAIIAVTDEPDQSPQTVDFYYKAFLSIKGFQNRHLFSFHAITGDPGTGCVGNGAAGSGERLKGLVDRTDGGVFQSICASDWAESLGNISLAAFGYKDCFYLANVPEDTDEDGEILVKVAGHVLGSSDWSYSAARNAVCFDLAAIPKPGTEIEISYRVACVSGG